MLTYKVTTEEVTRQLAKGQASRRRRSLLETFLRLQALGLGVMPHWIPATPRLKPREYEPLAGPELGKRLMEKAEEMDVLLATARRKFGIQACGKHPFYGSLRVDEWRRYHALHAKHHLRQLKQAIAYAKSAKAAEVTAAKSA